MTPTEHFLCSPLTFEMQCFVPGLVHQNVQIIWVYIHHFLHHYLELIHMLAVQLQAILSLTTHLNPLDHI